MPGVSMRKGVQIAYGQRILSPKDIAGLAAWYDVSDGASLLKSNGSQVTAVGDTVALITDKSGNSGVNCLCSNGVAGNTSYAATGSNIGTGDFTLIADIRCSVVASNGDVAGFRSSVPDSSSPGSAFAIGRQFGTPANMVVVIYGATGTDFRYYRFVNYFSINSGQRKTISVTRSGTTVNVYSDGIVITPDAEVTGGTAPAWSGTVNTTYITAGTTNTVVVTSDNIFNVRAYSSALSAANILADYQNGSVSTPLINIAFSIAPKLASSFVTSTGQTLTLISSGATGARISGERDLVNLTAASQPTYLGFGGTQYGWLRGASGTYFSTPDSTAVSITGDVQWDIDLIISALPASTGYIFNKYVVSGGQQSWLIGITSTGAIRLEVSTTGIDSPGATIAAGAISAGVRTWIRITRVQSSGLVTVLRSLDGVNYSSLGTATVSAGSAMFDSNSAVVIGGYDNGISVPLSVGCVINRAQIYNGINGTLAFDFNPATYTSGTTFLDSSSNAATITLNGGATIVTKTCLYFDGSNDYAKSAAFSLSQPETVYFTGQQVSWTAADRFWDGNSSDSMSAQQGGSSPSTRISSDGYSNQLINSSFILQTIAVFMALYNAASSLYRNNRNNPASGNTGTGNGNGYTLGARSDATSFANITASEILIYSTAQDLAAQNLLITYEGAKWRINVAA